MTKSATTLRRQAAAKSTGKDVRPLEAYGPGNVLIAQSWDGGKTWDQTDEGRKLAEPPQQPRVFTRRISAVVNEATPSTERRIATPFAVMHEANILAGWAPYAELAALQDGALDAIVLPNPGATDEELRELKRVGTRLLLDLDAPMMLDEDGQDKLRLALEHVDAVTVPTDLLASKIRPYHPHVFTVPSLVRPELWTGTTRYPGKPPVRIGLPVHGTEGMELAVSLLQAKYGERVQWTRFDAMTLSPAEEVEIYTQFDIVILPPLPDRTQGSLAPVLPAQMAQCCVIGDRFWPGIKHDHSGMQVGRDSQNHWVQTINRAIQDSRLRLTIGRNARALARRWTPQIKLSQIVLPYRLTIPESAPVQYR